MNRETMSCRRFERSLAAYVDGVLPPGESREAASHLAACRECNELVLDNARMRETLRSVPPRPVPAGLSGRLRVLASRQAARRRARANWRSWCTGWLQGVELWSDNLMRPLALPTAGGFISALVLFAILAPTIAVSPNRAETRGDVPTALTTEPSVLRASPVIFDAEEIAIELTVDENGRMIDYTVPESYRMLLIKKPGLRREIERSLLFTEFTPATMFGQPKAGKLRLTLRTSSIEVKG
ncbi:MAG: zf-HC2 domain-containing protein [Acidobacteria bacterium]|nr:zf-HC2 domain-containing protein [Acidobacteriota bacterium]MBI3279254.1 zf-HC2 domain-containing protein [Acidobacteriota bacterium]